MTTTIPNCHSDCALGLFCLTHSLSFGFARYAVDIIRVARCERCRRLYFIQFDFEQGGDTYHEIQGEVYMCMKIIHMGGYPGCGACMERKEAR